MFRCKTLFSLIAALAFSISSAWSLPPAGLTPVYTGLPASSFSEIGVVDGTLYVSSFRGIFAVDESGVGEPRMFTLPGSEGSRATTERVFESTAGEPLFVTDFGDTITVYGWDDFANPRTTWSSDGVVLSGTPDGSVIVRNNIMGERMQQVLHPDGSTTPIPKPVQEIDFSGGDATPNGWILGISTVPGPLLDTIRDVLINTRGFYEPFGLTSTFDSTVRDREDDAGANVGLYGNLRYGDGRRIGVLAPPNSFRREVLVSETDFAVMHPDRGLDSASVFFPGIDPNDVNQAIPLLEVFPELQQLQENERPDVADIASSEGQIHLLLSGENGLWLYAAPDPSVIPEPTAATLALLAAGIMFSRRRR